MTLTFEDGDRAEADVVIGADGVHSIVRDMIVGPDVPIHKGRIAYRAVFPSALMGGRDVGRSRTKWWGIDRHIVIYYTRRDRSEIYFVTSVPEPAEWLTRESWSAKGDVHELRKAYDGFHPGRARRARRVSRLPQVGDPRTRAACPVERRTRRAARRRVPSDDPVHGAGCGDRDGGCRGARALPGGGGGRRPRTAFTRYEAHRKPRTSRIQAISSANTWMKGGNDDTSWLYGYDAWMPMLSYHAPDHPLRPGAPRLALIHSLALDRSVWDGVVRRLEGEAEILTYDCRGHGRSPSAAGPYTAPSSSRATSPGLLDPFGWDRTAVAGCSMGGNVAQAFAASYPERTTALGLIDTTAWYGADAPAKFKERADAARAKGMRGMIDFQLTRWFSDEFRASHPDVLTTDDGRLRRQRSRLLRGERASCSGRVDSRGASRRAARCRWRSSSARRTTRRRWRWRSSCTRRFRSRR